MNNPANNKDLVNSFDDKLSELIESGNTTTTTAAPANDEISLNSGNNKTAVVYNVCQQREEPVVKPNNAQTTNNKPLVKEQPQERELNDYVLVYNNKPIKDSEGKTI